MSKNLNGSFFTTKSLNGENDIEINKLVSSQAVIDDLSCNQLSIGDLNVIGKFGSIDNSINLLEQSIDDLSSNLDISSNSLDVSLNANINNLTTTGTTNFQNSNLQLGATTMYGNILGNNHNIAGLNNITSSQGTIDTLTTTNLTTTNLTTTNLTTTDLTCNNDITCNNDLSVDGDGNFKSLIVNDTGTTGGSIDLTGELTINTPAFYGGTSGLKVNNTSYFNANVGIGIDSASSPLHIYESTGSGSINSPSGGGAIVLEHGNNGGSSRILFKSKNNAGSDFGALHYDCGIGNNNEESRLLLVCGNDSGSSNKDQIRLRTDEKDGFMLDGNGRVVMGITDANLEIKRNGEDMVLQTYIDNNGYDDEGYFPSSNDRYKLVLQDRHGIVLMGSRTKGNRNGVLHIISQQEAPRQDGMTFVASNNTNNIINFENTGRGARGQIKGNGSGSVLYQTSSDRRLKTNIEDMDNQLDNIMNLQPRKFDWISDNEKGYGFIAQEVHNIYPQFRDNYNETYCADNPNYNVDCPCDSSGNMWYYGLDYGNFTPYIIKAFQEYKLQTDTLIQNLEERIKALEEI